jgi:hypothetical protein
MILVLEYRIILPVTENAGRMILYSNTRVEHKGLRTPFLHVLWAAIFGPNKYRIMYIFKKPHESSP